VTGDEHGSLEGATYRRRVPKIDSQTAVLLAIVGVAVALMGIAFLLVGAWVPGTVVVALGLASGSVGYGAVR
jgi:hypothetical protein